MNDVFKAIDEKRVIAIMRGFKVEEVLKIAAALQRGGINMMEITYNPSMPETHIDTVQAISSLKKLYGNDIHVGAGTVLTEKQVLSTRAAGGEFIISPNVNTAVIKKTVECGLVSMPGAMTPTEAEAAHEAGAHFVKIFPSVSLGPEYIKAICAPLSHIKFLVVGGVSPETIPSFIKAGAYGVGTGGDLIIKSAVEAGDYDAITRRAMEYNEAVKIFVGGKK